MSDKVAQELPPQPTEPAAGAAQEPEPPQPLDSEAAKAVDPQPQPEQGPPKPSSSASSRKSGEQPTDRAADVQVGRKSVDDSEEAAIIRADEEVQETLQQPPPPQFTGTDFKSFTKTMFLTFGTLGTSTLVAPFRGKKGAPSFKRHVAYRTVRSFHRRADTKMLQAMSPKTFQTYGAFCRSKRLTEQVVDLDHNAKALWLGDRAEGTIIIGGDSAGANLALGLLSHLLHPNPLLDPARGTGSFKGVALLSPLVTFDLTAPSIKKNEGKDVLERSTLKRWADNYLAGTAQDAYNAPLGAEAGWWEDMPTEALCVVAGEDEMFIDDIRAFVEKLKKHHEGKLVYTEGKGEAHDAPIFDYLFGAAHRKFKEAIDTWIVERV
ncbi:unnamed protein product [Parascedosporium putredinis]|uniref:Alpha/beta hydrolase fold-3 domain-containing protein n=1 Tax=Parascedosporium putredinis TaxID=1442378 RepID=A0A9P1M7M4_9PEZI|nr:unnamed protein product [Parascedosporium putredinis]CAI7988331.1 unnamed protein product [Parascedosporium putredinis]